MYFRAMTVIQAELMYVTGKKTPTKPTKQPSVSNKFLRKLDRWAIYSRALGDLC